MPFGPHSSAASAASDDQGAPPGIVAALSVYLEPLAADARVAVVGGATPALADRLLELGARTVNFYDPDEARAAALADVVPRGVSVRALRGAIDVRDGAFDLVVVPDVGALPEPAATIGDLRRVLDGRGAVVAMGRATTAAGGDEPDGTFPELAPAAVEYAELYDLFASQFDSVTMNGVLPFAGVVFAELGASDDLAVSVDTRLVPPSAPGVFVVVASRDVTELDPYAIVQVAPEAVSGAPAAAREGRASEALRDEGAEARAMEAQAAFAAMQLKAELLEAQLDEHRGRVLAAESRGAEAGSRLEVITLERDVAVRRVAELEAMVASAQQALLALEKKVALAERGMLDRDDRIAALNAELDAREGQGVDLASIDPAEFVELSQRAQTAEASLALHVQDLAHVAEAHAAETAALEAQLRERASLIKEMERELGRREHLVRELVAALEETRETGVSTHAFEAATAPVGVPPQEVVRLRRKLDDLAMEVARREGELEARAWRITELENEVRRVASAAASASAASPAASPVARSTPPPSSADASRAIGLERELASVRDEIDALRQALTQEHAARVAAESGEELARARAELARQAALLEQLRAQP